MCRWVALDHHPLFCQSMLLPNPRSRTIFQRPREIPRRFCLGLMPFFRCKISGISRGCHGIVGTIIVPRRCYASTCNPGATKERCEHDKNVFYPKNLALGGQHDVQEHARKTNTIIECPERYIDHAQGGSANSAVPLGCVRSIH